MTVRKYYPGYEHNVSGGTIKYLENIVATGLHRAKWQCYCNNIFEATVCNVITGHVKSCGCLNKLIIYQKNIKIRMKTK